MTNGARIVIVPMMVESAKKVLFLLYSCTQGQKIAIMIPSQHDAVPQHLHCISCREHQLASAERFKKKKNQCYMCKLKEDFFVEVLFSTDYAWNLKHVSHKNVSVFIWKVQLND